MAFQWFVEFLPFLLVETAATLAACMALHFGLPWMRRTIGRG